MHVYIVCAAGAMRPTVGVRYLDSIKVTSWHTLFCSLQIRHSFSELKRGLIMASGGSSVLDEYEWETLPDMLVARCYSVAAYHEGRLYVFGRSFSVCLCGWLLNLPPPLSFEHKFPIPTQCLRQT